MNKDEYFALKCGITVSVSLGIILYLLLARTSPDPLECTGIGFVIRHDTTYYEVACPRGAVPPFKVEKP